jgi:hypothetical protein
MSTSNRESRIYLTGSVNLPTVPEVFTFVGDRLQPGVTRVPDGEPGERANWVLAQAPYFAENPQLVGTPGPDGRDRYRLAAGVTPETLKFARFDYPDQAQTSYEQFIAARKAGKLASESRFLISIPTPFNAVNSFALLDDQLDLLPGYERALHASLDEIQARIPLDDLAVQFDLPTELATFEGWFPNPFRDREEILAATARLASWIQPEVDLTFHLCFGDSKFGASPFMGEPESEEAARRGGRHIWPRDARSVVDLANGLVRHVDRHISAFQAATVTSWARPAHWQPLSDLALDPGTEFHLGVVHAAADGLEGAQARTELARRFLPEFGFSTECGLGRHSAAELDEAVEILRALVGSREAVGAAP